MSVAAVAIAMLGAVPTANAAPVVGNGFAVTAGDLAFILKQIKIAERHAATHDAGRPVRHARRAPGDGIPDAEQVPDLLTSYGLRTVDGSCNNLFAGTRDRSAPPTRRSRG